jgi:predicted GIY-YIG superfamily endonuclease
MFYVYVIQSESDFGLYIGMSSDLRRRFMEHQSGKSQSTKGRGPWMLIYYEANLEKPDAEGREKFLKSGAGHAFLDKQLRAYFANSPRKRVKEY